MLSRWRPPQIPFLNQKRSAVPFPKWMNVVLPVVAMMAGGGGAYAALMLVYGMAPGTQRIGYAPKQPVPYSHAQHAGFLGMDCRYCHTTVEVGATSAIPPTQTCMNCHTNIFPESENLIRIRESHATGLPVQWVRVHDLPDFVYFNHSAHVTRGVPCVSCHGRVDKMEVVTQEQPLTMGWCLDCHRNPDPHLRHPEDVTKMDYLVSKERQQEIAREVRALYNINPSTDCSTCHR